MRTPVEDLHFRGVERRGVGGAELCPDGIRRRVGVGRYLALFGLETLEKTADSLIGFDEDAVDDDVEGVAGDGDGVA